VKEDEGDSSEIERLREEEIIAEDNTCTIVNHLQTCFVTSVTLTDNYFVAD
jgi:hypothetical protein